jgi:hypothetical protein
MQFATPQVFDDSPEDVKGHHAARRPTDGYPQGSIGVDAHGISERGGFGLRQEAEPGEQRRR